jgi:hypothetical protein
MLHAVFKLALITIAIDPSVDPVAVRFAEFPLTDVGISFGTFPHPGAVFHAIQPLSFIKFTVGPCIPSNTLWLAIDIVALKDGAISKLLDSFTMFEIVLPLPFIDPEPPFTILDQNQIQQLVILLHQSPALIINHNSLSMSFAVNKITVIHRLFIFFKLQTWRRVEFFYVDVLLVGLV